MLKAKGYSDSQVNLLQSLVSEAIEESIQNITDTIASKQDQEQLSAENTFYFSQLKKDIELIGQQDFFDLKNVVGEVTTSVQNIKDYVRDEVQRIRGGVLLDINLEKSRIKDESMELNIVMAQVEQRVEEETEAINSRMERIKQTTRSGLIRFFLGCAAFFLTFKLGLWVNYYWKNSRDISKASKSGFKSIQ